MITLVVALGFLGYGIYAASRTRQNRRDPADFTYFGNLNRTGKIYFWTGGIAVTLAIVLFLVAR